MRRAVALRAWRYCGLASALVAAAIAAGAAIDASGHALVVNISPSMPAGVYWLARGAARLQRGRVVMFAPPDGVGALIYGRGWLPERVPLLKTVGGVVGDTFCVRDGRFVVNGTDAGPVFARDSAGRPVPRIVGCHRVGAGQFLPVASTLDRSFDGRYMGTVPVRQVLGVGRALVTF